MGTDQGGTEDLSQEVAAAQWASSACEQSAASLAAKLANKPDERVPAARCRAVALCVEPLSKAQRLAPSGGHPSRKLTATLRARRRAGCRRTAAQGPGRCARQFSDQGFAVIAMPNSQVRPAMPAWMTTAARSRARGSRALFPSRVRERGPLDELTRCWRAARHFAALRSAPQAAPVPDRHPGHPPRPMPGR